MPLQLTFDKANDEPYNIAHKYFPEGKLLGSYLSTTLWPDSRLSLGGRGYWHMYAASDRIGAIINENYAGATPEWLEWDLNGVIVGRTPVPAAGNWSARAYTGNGRLYAQFPTQEASPEPDLKVLGTATGNWLPAVRTYTCRKAQGRSCSARMATIWYFA